MLLIELQHAVTYDVDILRFVALTENRLVWFHGHEPRGFREYGPLGTVRRLQKPLLRSSQ